LGLWGVVKNFHPAICHVITSNVEHKAVLEVVQHIGRAGYPTTIVDGNAFGQTTVQELKSAHRPTTRLVSVMAANNEVGSLNPIAEIGAWCRQHGILFHCDAAQALGKIALDLSALPVDLMSFSAHKLYGPKGVGALFVRKGLAPQSILAGGSQECGLRPGTLNVPAIVGFGAACEIAGRHLSEEYARLSDLRDATWLQLKAVTPLAELNGHPSERLPGHLNFTVSNLDPDALSLGLAEFALSRGSACSQNEASYVLQALGRTRELAQKSLRIGFGRFNTAEHAVLLCSRWSRLFESPQRCYIGGYDHNH
jgi:cysteine desulfurase